MNSQQIAYCAEDICNSQDMEVWCLSLDEIQLCMENGINGKYGTIYDRIDQSIIFGWLRSFWQERMTALVHKRENELQNRRMNISEVFQNDTMTKILKDVTDKLTIHEVKEEPKEPSKKTEWEQMIIDEFYKLEPTDRPGLRIYNGKGLDIDEYSQVRWNETIPTE